MSNIDEISDCAWTALAPHLAGKAGEVGRTGADNRLFLDAVFWVARLRLARAAWPLWQARHAAQTQPALGQKGIWQRLFEAVQEPDLDRVMLDSTGVRAHAQAAGSRKKAASGTQPPAAVGVG